MTSSLHDVCSRAMRSAAILDAVTDMSAEDAAVALRLAVGMLGQSGPLGRQLTETSARESLIAEADSRVVLEHGAAITITLPQRPFSGAVVQIIDATGALASFPLTIANNGRLLEGAGAALTVSESPFSRRWMYVGPASDWRRLDALTLASDFPLGDEAVEDFTLMLALRLCVEFGVSASPELLVLERAARNRIKGEFVRHRGPVYQFAFVRIGDT